MDEQNIEQQIDNAAEQIASQILADNSTEQVVAEEPQAQQSEQPVQQDIAALVEARMRDFIGREQGRLAQESGQRIAALRNEIKEELRSALEPLRKENQQKELERLRMMDSDELAQMIMEQRVQPAKAEALATGAQELIASNNLAINFDDVRVWNGWQQGMSLVQSLDVARKNIEALSGNAAKAAPAAPQAAQRTVTPSTQGAPQKTAKTIKTRSELAELFAEGRIDSSQYRAAKEQLRSGGSATL
jgi:hypothetical protein